jgi:hypothetical protein
LNWLLRLKKSHQPAHQTRSTAKSVSCTLFKAFFIRHYTPQIGCPQIQELHTASVYITINWSEVCTWLLLLDVRQFLLTCTKPLLSFASYLDIICALFLQLVVH